MEAMGLQPAPGAGRRAEFQGPTPTCALAEAVLAQRGQRNHARRFGARPRARCDETGRKTIF